MVATSTLALTLEGAGCKGALFLDLLVALLAAFRDSSSMISFKLLEEGDGVAKVGGRDLPLAPTDKHFLGFRGSSSMISLEPSDAGVLTLTAVGSRRNFHLLLLHCPRTEVVRLLEGGLELVSEWQSARTTRKRGERVSLGCAFFAAEKVGHPIV